MTDLHQALTDIRSIRRHVAQTSQFHGYGPLTLFATAAAAVLAGVAQAHWISDPAAHPAQYAALWLATGIICAALISSQMVMRVNRLHSGIADEMLRMAVAQFLPAAVAGLVLPAVLCHLPAVFWMLPGLWQIIFGLGVFASCRCLPRAMLLSGVWFLATGFTCISLGDARALAPLTMSGAYAAGMGYVALVHHLSSKEISDDRAEL